MPYNALLQAHTMQFPPTLLRVGSVCGLGPDILGIHTLSLAARYRTASNSGTLANGLAKIQAAREYDHALHLCSQLRMEGEFFELLPWPITPWRHLKLYFAWITMANLMTLLMARNKKAATALLRDEFQKQDFAKPMSLRASRILGPVSRFRIAQIMPQKNRASRASRPGLTVGLLRILCNGLFTAQSFHVEGEAQMCRVGCPDEPDSLSHYNESPLLYNFFASVWGQSTVLPRRGHLFHDLITQVFLRSLQYGIVVMGVIDAFVYAHNHHRRNIDNPVNFGDCMKGRIRFMTAITPAYANACQLICLTRHIPVVPSQKFRLLAAKVRLPYLPNVRTTTRERGNDFQSWAIYTDGRTRLADGETFSRNGVLSHDLSIEE